MTREELLKELNEVVQADADMTETTVLAEIDEWDSLALVATLSMFNRKFGKRPDMAELKRAKTVSDILNLAKDFLS